MNATLSFNLPGEAEAHQAALEGPKWKCLVQATDQDLRNWLKHGHTFTTPDEALQAMRDKLYADIDGAGLALYT